MRTVKVKLIVVADRDITLEYETESIVEDEHAEDEGAKAGSVIRAFQRGVSRAYDEDE